MTSTACLSLTYGKECHNVVSELSSCNWRRRSCYLCCQMFQRVRIDGTCHFHVPDLCFRASNYCIAWSRRRSCEWVLHARKSSSDTDRFDADVASLNPTKNLLAQLDPVSARQGVHVRAHEYLGWSPQGHPGRKTSNGYASCRVKCTCCVLIGNSMQIAGSD